MSFRVEGKDVIALFKLQVGYAGEVYGHLDVARVACGKIIGLARIDFRIARTEVDARPVGIGNLKLGSGRNCDLTPGPALVTATGGEGQGEGCYFIFKK